MKPEEIKNYIIQNGLSGIDWIVPVGETVDFGLFWDVYDLIMAMSKIVDFI